jgi:integrase
MSTSHPPVVLVTRPSKAEKVKANGTIAENVTVRNHVIYARVKSPDRPKPLMISTRFKNTTADGRANGLKRALEIIKEEREKVHGYKKRALMPTLADHYATYKAAFLAEKPTQEQIHSHLGRIEPFVARYGHKDLDAIERDDCAQYIIDRRKVTHRLHTTYKEGTIRTHCETIRSFFQKAVGKNKLLVENPWKGVKLPDQSSRERVLTDEEFLAIFTALPVLMRRLLVFVINCGLRRNEFTYIKSSDIRGHLIHVPAAIAKRKKARTVSITDDVVALVDLQRAHLGISATSRERVFPYFKEKLGRAIHQACKDAGIIDPGDGTLKVTAHDLRRTWATRLTALLHPKELMVLLGHSPSSLAVTMRHYIIADKLKVAEKVHQAPTLFPVGDVTLDVTATTKNA